MIISLGDGVVIQQRGDNYISMPEQKFMDILPANYCPCSLFGHDYAISFKNDDGSISEQCRCLHTIRRYWRKHHEI